MKRNVIFLTLLVGWFSNLNSSKAQGVFAYLVKGVVTDSITRKPIEVATISLLNADKKVVALTYSDENGLFKSTDIAPGAYFLSLSFMGYTPVTKPFAVAQDSPVVDVGTLWLQPQARQLATVTVIGSRQLVEQQPGMLIYNAEKDISNQGGTAADVLRKAPILNVDAAGNVTMRGNRNLHILINGKYSGQMARNAADALNMMPANSIKAVEVITSPSARYDAEGAAGVINIITKKSRQSVIGNVELVGGNLQQALNPRLALSRGKWNLGSYLHLHQFRKREENNMGRLTVANGQPTGRLQQTVVRDNHKPHSSGDVQLEFTPDSANRFSLSVNGWLGNWPENRDQYTERFSTDGVVLENYRQQVTTQAPNRGIDLNLGYTHTFHKPGKELYLMARHSNSVDNYSYDARQQAADRPLLYRETNDNRTHNQEWTFQTDYIQPFAKQAQHAWESGAKLILRTNRSNYQVAASADTNPDQLIAVASRSDVFSYAQNVALATVSLNSNGRRDGLCR